jgi:hypothetical protein
MSLDLNDVDPGDLPALLATLEICVAAADRQGFWFIYGAAYMALRRAGYTLAAGVVPIDPADHWRVALEALAEAAPDTWATPPVDPALWLHRRLQPPD